MVQLLSIDAIVWGLNRNDVKKSGCFGCWITTFGQKISLIDFASNRPRIPQTRTNNQYLGVISTLLCAPSRATTFNCYMLFIVFKKPLIDRNSMVPCFLPCVDTYAHIWKPVMSLIGAHMSIRSSLTSLVLTYHLWNVFSAVLLTSFILIYHWWALFLFIIY